MSFFNSAVVVHSPCHETFYGKYRTYLKQARNLPQKGQKRRGKKGVGGQQASKRIKQQPERIEDMQALEKLKGKDLEAQMQAWCVPIRKKDPVKVKRKRLLDTVWAWLQEQKKD